MKLGGVFASAAAAALLTFSTHAAAATELVTNGGFETGDFTGWTLTGNTSFTDVVDSSVSIWPVVSGVYTARLGPPFSPGTLSQNLATSSGVAYVISFDLANGSGIPTSFSADFGGDNLLSLSNPPSFDFTHYSFVETASGPTTLSFTYQQDSTYLFLDDVSVSAVVPEPTAWALLITGFLGVGLALRGARRKAAFAA